MTSWLLRSSRQFQKQHLDYTNLLYKCPEEHRFQAAGNVRKNSNWKNERKKARKRERKKERREKERKKNPGKLPGRSTTSAL